MHHFFTPELNLNVKIVGESGFLTHVTLSLTSTCGLTWSLYTRSPDLVLEEQINQWFKTYLRKEEPDFSLPFKLDIISPFTLRVLTGIRSYSFGTTGSYKTLAHLLSSSSYRAVGGACGRNPFPLFIPCHRILSATGQIGGFTGGIELKKHLLAFEGILY